MFPPPEHEKPGTWEVPGFCFWFVFEFRHKSKRDGLPFSLLFVKAYQPGIETVRLYLYASNFELPTGSVSHAQATEKAKEEYRKYQATTEEEKEVTSV